MQLAQAADELRIFGKGFHQDQRAPSRYRGGVCDPFLSVDERARLDVGHQGRVLQQAKGERLEPGLARNLGVRAPLRLER